MKINNYIIIVLVLIYSCQYEKTKKDTSIIFYTEPSLSTIEGILELDTVFGSPNYGENPTIDSKEVIYTIKLNNAINVIDFDKQTNLNDTLYNVLSFQLVGSKLKQLKSKIGNKVKVNGTFSLPVSGHHRTEIIFNVK